LDRIDSLAIKLCDLTANISQIISSDVCDTNLLNNLIFSTSDVVIKLIFASASLRKLQSNPKPIIGIFLLYNLDLFKAELFTLILILEIAFFL
jgi:hypothetical protein